MSYKKIQECFGESFTNQTHHPKLANSRISIPSTWVSEIKTLLESSCISTNLCVISPSTDSSSTPQDAVDAVQARNRGEAVLLGAIPDTWPQKSSLTSLPEYPVKDVVNIWAKQFKESRNLWHPLSMDIVNLAEQCQLSLAEIDKIFTNAATADAVDLSGLGLVSVRKPGEAKYVDCLNCREILIEMRERKVNPDEQGETNYKKVENNNNSELKAAKERILDFANSESASLDFTGLFVEDIYALLATKDNPPPPSIAKKHFLEVPEAYGDALTVLDKLRAKYKPEANRVHVTTKNTAGVELEVNLQPVKSTTPHGFREGVLRSTEDIAKFIKLSDAVDNLSKDPALRDVYDLFKAYCEKRGEFISTHCNKLYVADSHVLDSMLLDDSFREDCKSYVESYEGLSNIEALKEYAPLLIDFELKEEGDWSEGSSAPWHAPRISYLLSICREILPDPVHKNSLHFGPKLISISHRLRSRPGRDLLILPVFTGNHLYWSESTETGRYVYRTKPGKPSITNLQLLKDALRVYGLMYREEKVGGSLCLENYPHFSDEETGNVITDLEKTLTDCLGSGSVLHGGGYIRTDEENRPARLQPRPHHQYKYDLKAIFYDPTDPKAGASGDADVAAACSLRLDYVTDVVLAQSEYEVSASYSDSLQVLSNLPEQLTTRHSLKLSKTTGDYGMDVTSNTNWLMVLSPDYVRSFPLENSAGKQALASARLGEYNAFLYVDNSSFVSISCKLGIKSEELRSFVERGMGSQLAAVHKAYKGDKKGDIELLGQIRGVNKLVKHLCSLHVQSAEDSPEPRLLLVSLDATPFEQLYHEKRADYVGVKLTGDTASFVVLECKGTESGPTGPLLNDAQKQVRASANWLHTLFADPKKRNESPLLSVEWARVVSELYARAASDNISKQQCDALTNLLNNAWDAKTSPAACYITTTTKGGDTTLHDEELNQITPLNGSRVPRQDQPAGPASRKLLVSGSSEPLNFAVSDAEVEESKTLLEVMSRYCGSDVQSTDSFSPDLLSAGPLTLSMKVRLTRTARRANLTSHTGDFEVQANIDNLQFSSANEPGCILATWDRKERRFPSVPGPAARAGDGKYLTFYIGCDTAGRPVTSSLSDWPHMLVAGTTGSGKSVFLQSLLSQLNGLSPSDVQVVLVDGKDSRDYVGLLQPELFHTEPVNLYDPTYAIPEAPWIGTKDDATSAVAWAVEELRRRQQLERQHSGAKAKDAYLAGEPLFPALLVVIDEFAHVLTAGDGRDGKEIREQFKSNVTEIARLGRSYMIHLVLATQTPTSVVLWSDLRNNVSTRVAFTVSDVNYSVGILGGKGAESLRKKGDMLFTPDGGDPMRLQGYKPPRVDI